VIKTVAAVPNPEPAPSWSAAIFDVDGVLLASPHEQAWREALNGFADPTHFTTAMYQAEVAGKPREAGALAGLRALGVPDAERLAPAYAACKQQLLEALVEAGAVAPFPDALRFVDRLLALGWRLAAASSSKNANAMMQSMVLPSGTHLLKAFAANVCGRDVEHGKPAPDLFLCAAAALGIAPEHCVVIEDAPAGISAARNAGMATLGVARYGDTALLHAAGADCVVASLDDVAIDGLRYGQLQQR
jgi:HAD superfamily hydrolase (TIGR01509 family)